MPRAKYDRIYRDLKEKIEAEQYLYQEMLPSEHVLVEQYGCSRNTVRRALAELAAEGYVQPMQGRGVRNIYQPVDQNAYTVGGIESFKEASERNQRESITRVLQFSGITADARIEKKTGFPRGTEILYIQRLRILDEKPLILDHNYFLRELMPELTPQIAEGSVYEYLEDELGMNIATSKRTLTVEHVTQVDEKYIDLNGYNCMAVITSQTYNDEGIQFEYTQSRHHPDYFQFQDVAVRKKSGIMEGSLRRELKLAGA